LVLLKWVGDNAATLVAIAAIVAAWLIYRQQQATERQGLVEAVFAELRLHSAWVGSSYELLCWPPKDIWWSREQMATRQPVPLVNRLSTVATDAAIDRGPAMFINPSLVLALVGYRQRVGQFNQLIDNAMAFQASPELWEKGAAGELWDHFAWITAWIHWVGIGGAPGSSNGDGAHAHYAAAIVQLERERRAGRYPRFMWFWLGRRWPT
jgi:hypothetical protein